MPTTTRAVAPLPLPDSPLRPLAGWRDAVREGPVPTVFLVHGFDDVARGAELAAELPLVVRTRRWVVYGPCLPEAH